MLRSLRGMGFLLRPSELVLLPLALVLVLLALARLLSSLCLLRKLAGLLGGGSGVCTGPNTSIADSRLGVARFVGDALLFDDEGECEDDMGGVCGANTPDRGDNGELVDEIDPPRLVREPTNCSQLAITGLRSPEANDLLVGERIAASS